MRIKTIISIFAIFLSLLMKVVIADEILDKTEESFPIHFLGVPVDGDINTFKRLLSERGFKADEISSLAMGLDEMEGSFMGSNVRVSISVNESKKVWKLSVFMSGGDDLSNAVSMFNSVCNKFKSNNRYIKKEGCYPISSTTAPIRYFHHAVFLQKQSSDISNDQAKNRVVEFWPSIGEGDYSSNYQLIINYVNVRNKPADLLY